MPDPIMQFMKTCFRSFVWDSPFGSMLLVLQYEVSKRWRNKKLLRTLQSKLKIRKLVSIATTSVLTSHAAKRPVSTFSVKMYLAIKRSN